MATNFHRYLHRFPGLFGDSGSRPEVTRVAIDHDLRAMTLDDLGKLADERDPCDCPGCHYENEQAESDPAAHNSSDPALCMCVDCLSRSNTPRPVRR